MTTKYVQEKGLTIDSENSLESLPMKNIYLGLGAAEEIAKLPSDTETCEQPDNKKEKLKAKTGKSLFVSLQFL